LSANPSPFWEAGVAAVVLSSAATLFSTARSDHPEHPSDPGRKVFAIRPEWCSASNRNAVRDHRNAVRDQIGMVFGIARIPQKVQEMAFHPGFYRVALAVNSRDELPKLV
jgi:hypothetical protein